MGGPFSSEQGNFVSRRSLHSASSNSESMALRSSTSAPWVAVRCAAGDRSDVNSFMSLSAFLQRPYNARVAFRI